MILEKPKKKKTKRYWIKKCDKVFSEIVRSVGVCERCGTTKNLQCAHIVSRVNHSIRFDLENGIALCYSCHLMWAHKNPLEFAEWLYERYGEDIHQRLKDKANKIESIDYEEKYKELLNLKEGIK